MDRLDEPPAPVRITRHDGYQAAAFTAMASPCELLMETDSDSLALQLARAGCAEVTRIEHKFSRYNPASLCSRINSAGGRTVAIDDECHRLLEFAQTAYQLSAGAFDLTSGVLRRAWHFDGSDRLPTQAQIDALLPLVGWHWVQFEHEWMRMKPGMEIDFGGIGKEYAVSRVADICRRLAPDTSVLINLGGDLQITRPRAGGAAWHVGIERILDDGPTGDHAAPALHSMAGAVRSAATLMLKQGALATSGDAKRYLLKDGQRFGHILDPKTGWPATQAPASVTVAAPLCIQAGCLATLSLLQGGGAEDFLQRQKVQYWCEWR